MTVTMVGAISAKGILKGEPEPLKISEMRANGMVFYLTNLRQVTIKGRRENPDKTVYEGDVLDIEGVRVGSVRLDTPGVMDDVDTLIAYASESQEIPENEAAALVYGPLRVTRTRRVFHLAADDED